MQIHGFKALGEATGERAWEDHAFSTLAELIERATANVEGSRSKVEGRRLQPSTVNSQPISVRVAVRIDFGGGWTDTPPKASNAVAPCSTPR